MDLLASAERAKELKAESQSWESWDLTPRQICDLELLMNGGFSPLTGFMGRRDYESVCSSMRLQDGTLWPIPIVLDVSDKFAGGVKQGDSIALRDPEGVVLAVLKVEDIWQPDKRCECELVYGTANMDLVRTDLARWDAVTNWNSSSDADVLVELEEHGITADRIVLWGTGRPYREFMHVNDPAEAALLLMEDLHAGQIGEVINVGTGQDITIAEMAQKVAREVSYTGAIEFDSSKPDGTPRKLLDVSHIGSLGWNPKIPFATGIRHTYKWYLDVVT